jgi:hypothetical protein
VEPQLGKPLALFLQIEVEYKEGTRKCRSDASKEVTVSKVLSQVIECAREERRE